MELTHDWRGFQDLFYPHKRALGPTQPEKGKPQAIHVVAEGDVVLTAFCEGEDLSMWVGASLGELQSQTTGRDLCVFERKDVEKWIADGLAMPNFHEQVESYRAKAKPVRGSAPSIRKHFLLEALDGWWGKVFPSSYGLFLRVGGDSKNPERDFVLIIRRGKLDAFFVPDLHSLGAERRKEGADVVKYLSEKHLVPFQGVFVGATAWSEWSRNPSPWREVARSIKSNRLKLVPFRFGIAFLSTTRGFLKV
jgi:hypothetical protein